ESRSPPTPPSPAPGSWPPPRACSPASPPEPSCTSPCGWPSGWSGPTSRSSPPPAAGSPCPPAPTAPTRSPPKPASAASCGHRRRPGRVAAVSSSSMDPRPIGIFDSGGCGLTVARAVIDLLPQESVIYFGDTARFPYGPRSQAQVRRFAEEIMDLLVAEDVKLAGVACTSASARAFEGRRARCLPQGCGVGGRGGVAE